MWPRVHACEIVDVCTSVRVSLIIRINTTIKTRRYITTVLTKRTYIGIAQLGL